MDEMKFFDIDINKVFEIKNPETLANFITCYVVDNNKNVYLISYRKFVLSEKCLEPRQIVELIDKFSLK